MSGSTKVVLGVLGALLLVLLVAFAGGGLFGSGPMMYPDGTMGQGGMMGQQGGWGPGGMMDGGWGTWGIVWMFVPLLFWGGLIALLVWAVVRLASGRHGEVGLETREEAAEDILRQRFARGEIDAEEFEKRQRILSGGS